VAGGDGKLISTRLQSKLTKFHYSESSTNILDMKAGPILHAVIELFIVG